MALYQPRRAVIVTVLANVIQADFAEGSIAMAFPVSTSFGKTAGRKTHALSFARSSGKNYHQLS